MYEAHWNLTKKPFKNDLDLTFAFMWEGYDEALARMRYWAADGKRFAVLTGPSGVGKSYLFALLARDIRRRGDIVATVPNPCLSPTEFLEYVLTLYGHDDCGLTKSQALALLTHFAAENASQNTRTYLLIDEAQAIGSGETLEEINLILNLAEGQSPLFSVVMGGEGTLRDVMNGCPSLKQKIEIVAELPSLTLEETGAYVAHRLSVAGGQGGIFEPGAIERLYEWSKGLPRLVNTAADLALLAAYGEEKKTVDVESIDSGLEDIQSRMAIA